MKDTALAKQIEQETEEMLKLHLLTPDIVEFSRTEGGFVSLAMGEDRYDRVQILRMFPFLETTQYLSVRTMDGKFREIGMIKQLADFPDNVQRMIEEQLQIRYFTPIITKVNTIKEEYGFAYWNVTTNHGECRFTIRTGSNAIVHLSENRILIMDIDENRFEIPDVETLTPSERKKLDLYL